VITHKSERIKKAIINWCRLHGLENASVDYICEDCGWTSFSIYSSYLHNQNFLLLENDDTRLAFKELIEYLKRIDGKIRTRTNWQSLEKYIQLETEKAKWKLQGDIIETELNSEEQRLNRESEVHETEKFDEDEAILHRGNRGEISRQLNK
jgi:hypothetical protein